MHQSNSFTCYLKRKKHAVMALAPGTGCYCSVQASLLNHLPSVNGKHKQDYGLDHGKQDLQELSLALPVVSCKH